MDEKTVQRLEMIAEFSDDSIEVPGTNVRFGFDPLIGLLPGIGDAAGALLSSYIILEACRHRLPVSLILRMIFIALAELILGSVPILGDLFDFTWKANRRNVRLIQRYLKNRREVEKSSRLLVAAVFVPFLTVVFLFLFLLWKIIDWTFQGLLI